MWDIYKKLKVPYLEYSDSIDKMPDFILQDQNTIVVMMQTSSSFVVTADTDVCHNDNRGYLQCYKICGHDNSRFTVI